MNEQVEQALNEIMVEAGLLEPVGIAIGGGLRLAFAGLDAERAWRCVRSAYAHGYQDALMDAKPFPLTVASAVEREMWARLPVS